MLLLLAFDPRVFVRGPMQVSQWKLAWRFRPRPDWLATLDYCCLMVWSTCEFVVQMIWAYRLMDPCTYFHARCHGWCFLVGVGFSLSVLCLFLIGLTSPLVVRSLATAITLSRAPAEEKKSSESHFASSHHRKTARALITALELKKRMCVASLAFKHCVGKWLKHIFLSCNICGHDSDQKTGHFEVIVKAVMVVKVRQRQVSRSPDVRLLFMVNQNYVWLCGNKFKIVAAFCGYTFLPNSGCSLPGIYCLLTTYLKIKRYVINFDCREWQHSILWWNKIPDCGCEVLRLYCRFPQTWWHAEHVFTPHITETFDVILQQKMIQCLFPNHMVWNVHWKQTMPMRRRPATCSEIASWRATFWNMQEVRLPVSTMLFTQAFGFHYL